MMPSILISVALCTYNGEQYIEEQLQSVLNQTHQNLEVIIVDDCSVDHTTLIIKRYAIKDPRIKYFINHQNLGYNKNFEKAITLTSGAFIAICDQDDIWSLNKLEVLLDNIGDNWLIFSNSAYINENGIKLNQNLLTNFSITDKTYRTILLNNWLTGHTTLFSRVFLEHVIPFPEHGFYDWWLGFVAIYHHKISYLDQVLTLYRVHAQSVIQVGKQLQYKKYKKEQLDSTIVMLTAFINYKFTLTTDKKFIRSLLKALIIKKKYLNLIPLTKLLYTNYNDFYPERKRRTGFSKLNFVYKIAKEF